MNRPNTSGIAADDDRNLQPAAIVDEPAGLARLFAAHVEAATGETVDTVAQALMSHYANWRVRAAAEVSRLADIVQKHESKRPDADYSGLLASAMKELQHCMERERYHADVLSGKRRAYNPDMF